MFEKSALLCYTVPTFVWLTNRCPNHVRLDQLVASIRFRMLFLSRLSKESE
ncbi:predicted protein [Enterococcus casseliflavus EC30]|nr:predicted protein [Enterococcus casseliflavus EC30]